MSKEQSLTKLIKDEVNYCLNACKVKYVGFVKTTTGEVFQIELDLENAGNCFDSSSLQALLAKLQGLGIVKDNVKTMWFGLNNFEPQSAATYKIWCPTH